MRVGTPGESSGNRGSRLPFPGHSDIWALCKHLALPTSFTSRHSTLWLYSRHLYFPEEETEAQRGQASHPRSRSYRVAEVGFDPRSAETSTPAAAIQTYMCRPAEWKRRLMPWPLGNVLLRAEGDKTHMPAHTHAHTHRHTRTCTHAHTDAPMHAHRVLFALQTAHDSGGKNN